MTILAIRIENQPTNLSADRVRRLWRSQMTKRPERRNRSRGNGFEPSARGCSGIAELAPLLPIPYT